MVCILLRAFVDQYIEYIVARSTEYYSKCKQHFHRTQKELKEITRRKTR